MLRSSISPTPLFLFSFTQKIERNCFLNSALASKMDQIRNEATYGEKDFKLQKKNKNKVWRTKIWENVE